MRGTISWLLNILAVMFWVFRAIITFCDSLSIDFMVKPIDMNIEIGLLFVTFICLILILKRNIVGGLVYFAVYAGYFGMDIYNNILAGANANILSLLISILAILLALGNALDIALSKVRKKENPNKKTDWFYKEEKFDRILDERADKNNYRIH